ncbi:MAG: hypothetical protein H7Y88_09305 [Phycisphaerales bacterium]|nr:hypothetical protein [Phycisphaerales bacterium]
MLANSPKVRHLASILVASLFAAIDPALAQGPDYNRFVHASDMVYEPAPDGNGWLISAIVGLEAIPDQTRDLSLVLAIDLNGEVLSGGGSGDGTIHRWSVGPGIPTPVGPVCEYFCVGTCGPGTACVPLNLFMCMCGGAGSGNPPFPPGFRVTVQTPILTSGDVITIAIAAAPIPEALPEIDTTDDIASIVVDLAPPCPADFNDSGTVTSADITSFLAAWFSDLTDGTTVADFNQSGGTTSADITAFLSSWFEAIATGC